jgi:very-short-patch-repair endonuclease
MRSALPVLPAESTVLSCAEQLPLVEAVVIADSAVRVGATTVAALAAAASRLTGQAQRAAALRVVALVDPLAESVLESALRTRLREAGVDGFCSQVTVRSPTRRVLRVDLAFTAARLAVETDGKRWHRDLVKDQRTDNALAACGWRVLRYGWADVVHDHARVVAEVREALAA